MRIRKHAAGRITLVLAVLIAGVGLWSAPAGASSYKVRLIVMWYPRASTAEGSVSVIKGKFLPERSQCASGPDWRVEHGAQGGDPTQMDATHDIVIDTSLKCLGTPSIVAYKVTVEEVGNTYGPIVVGYTQYLPRVFSSVCTDDGPLKSSCWAIPGPLFRLEFHDLRGS